MQNYIFFLALVSNQLYLNSSVDCASPPPSPQRTTAGEQNSGTSSHGDLTRNDEKGKGKIEEVELAPLPPSLSPHADEHEHTMWLPQSQSQQRFLPHLELQEQQQQLQLVNFHNQQQNALESLPPPLAQSSLSGGLPHEQHGTALHQPSLSASPFFATALTQPYSPPPFHDRHTPHYDMHGMFRQNQLPLNTSHKLANFPQWITPWSAETPPILHLPRKKLPAVSRSPAGGPSSGQSVTFGFSPTVYENAAKFQDQLTLNTMESNRPFKKMKNENDAETMHQDHISQMISLLGDGIIPEGEKIATTDAITNTRKLIQFLEQEIINILKHNYCTLNSALFSASEKFTLNFVQNNTIELNHLMETAIQNNLAEIKMNNPNDEKQAWREKRNYLTNVLLATLPKHYFLTTKCISRDDIYTLAKIYIDEMKTILSKLPPERSGTF